MSTAFFTLTLSNLSNSLILVTVLVVLFQPFTISKRICFHSGQAEERGTTVSLHDYGHFAESLLGHESYFIFRNWTHVNQTNIHSMVSLPKFQRRFKTIVYQTEDANSPLMIQIVKELKCNLLYIMKSGSFVSEPSAELIAKVNIPTAIHAVFDWQPHGSAYASISMEVSRGANQPIVHHIVRPVDMKAFQRRLGWRKRLNIPDQAFVMCRHGGYDSFDLKFVHATLRDSVHRYNLSQLHYVFVNTEPFTRDKDWNIDLSNPQFHFLPIIIDDDDKEEFIRSCDAMIHGRRIGETFGLAVAEFSVHNKPVITFPGKAKFHVKTLGQKAFVYSNALQLNHIIDMFLTKGIPDKDYNGYQRFAPEFVMQEFKQIFLDPFFNESAPVLNYKAIQLLSKQKRVVQSFSLVQRVSAAAAEDPLIEQLQNPVKPVITTEEEIIKSKRDPWSEKKEAKQQKAVIELTKQKKLKRPLDEVKARNVRDKRRQTDR